MISISSIRHLITKYFPKGWTPYLVLALVILLRVEHRWHFPNIYLDNFAQAATYTNWQAGRGWVAYDPDWGELTSMHRFPPLYPILVGVLTQTGLSWTKAMRLLDGLFLAFIIIGFGRWMKNLGINRNLPLYCIFGAFSLAPLHYATSTGLMALAFFIWGSKLALQGLTIHKNYGKFTISCFLLGMGVWSRPAYLPFAALLPLFHFFIFIKEKNKADLIRSISASLMMGICCLSLLWWQSMGPNLLPPNEGYYPENLLSITPFVFKSIIYYARPHEIWLEQNLNWVYSLGKWILVIGSFGALFLVWHRKNLPFNWRVFTLTAIGLNLFFLGFLSCIHPPQDWMGSQQWTYVGEDRYFLPSMTLLLLWIMYEVDRKKWLRWGFVGLTVLYGGFFFLSRAYIYAFNDQELSFQQSYAYALENSLIELKKSNTGPILLQDDEFHYLLEAYELSPLQQKERKNHPEIYALVKKGELEKLNFSYIPVYFYGNWAFIKAENSGQGK